MPKLFTRNEGTVDRVLRVIVGLGLISLVFVGPKTMWGWIGLIPLITGLSGSCLAYNAFGWDTRGVFILQGGRVGPYRTVNLRTYPRNVSGPGRGQTIE